MKTKMNFKFWFPEQNTYMAIILLLAATVLFYNWILGALWIIVIAYLLNHNRKTSDVRTRQWTKYIESLSADIDETVKNAMLNLPIPFCILEIDGNINWYNNKFSDMLKKEELLGQNIEQIIPNLNLKRALNEKSELYTTVALNDRNFNVTYNIVKIDNKGEVKYLIMAYFVENTRLLSLSKRYYEEKPVFGIIQVDSFDEVLESAGSDMRPLLIADVERTLKTWADGVGAALQKTRSDRYILFMDNLILEGLEKQKFAVLDEIREINYGNSLPITLSIGIGTWGNTLLKSLEYSESALDLAQGRGGDQAVIKRKDKSTFYGGKSKGIEKKTKVKARLIAYALRDLINDSTNVLIMGHRHPDLDSMGAALGVRSMCSHMGKESSIVLQESNPSIDVLVKSVSAFGDYKNIFVKKEEAMRNAHSGTLLIVVDTHRPNFTECKELLDICDRVVVIDHHRRGIEFIENAVLSYHETYASSASEMVTELIQYISEKPYISKFESEALLAGITLDTKNFTFRTGVRTFEAAAMLKKIGADTAAVKRLFQGDMETFFGKAEVIKNAVILDKIIAMSVCPENTESLQLVIAQGADELLNIKGIKASFVLGKDTDGVIYVSARSMGEVNVQVILEKIGGGGHLDVAGAQITDSEIEEVKTRLENIIREYLKEVDL